MPLLSRCQRLPDSHPRSRDKRERDRDRAARSSSRGATPTRPPSARQVPGWLWLVAGVGGGMLITSLLHLWTGSEPAEPSQEVAAPVVAKAVPVQAPKPVEKAAAPAEPDSEVAPEPEDAGEAAEQATQFDFYTLLPEREVIVPERETAAAAKPATPTTANPASSAVATATAALVAPPIGSESYLLQAGSFRGNADAERRRAQIVALGLRARIETARAGSDTWYRVHAGPFTSRDQLAAARSQLSAQGIETLQIRQK